MIVRESRGSLFTMEWLFTILWSPADVSVSLTQPPVGAMLYRPRIDPSMGGWNTTCLGRSSVCEAIKSRTNTLFRMAAGYPLTTSSWSSSPHLRWISDAAGCTDGGHKHSRGLGLAMKPWNFNARKWNSRQPREQTGIEIKGRTFSSP